MSSKNVYCPDRFLVNNSRAGAVVTKFNYGPVAPDYVDASVIATERQLLSNRELLRNIVRTCGRTDRSTDAAGFWNSRCLQYS